MTSRKKVIEAWKAGTTILVLFICAGVTCLAEENLLNIGPRGDGTIAEASVAILEIGGEHELVLRPARELGQDLRYCQSITLERVP